MPPEPSDPEKSWKRALTVSAGIHFVILLIVIFGLPYLPQRYEEPIPIGIEVVDVSDIAQTTKPEASAQKAEKKAEEPTPPKPPQVKDIPKPAQPKPKPKPPEPKKEEPPKPPPQSDLADQPPEEKPEEKPEPKKEEKKEEPKEEPKKEEPDTQEDDFQAMLKNLDPDVAVEKPSEDNMMTTAPPDETASAGTLGDRITMSEMDALRRQLSQCWSVLAGANAQENLVIEIRMTVNADRTLQSAEVVDQGRYNSDSLFAAAADTALRAVRSPMCSPLNLPPEKYDQWKSIKVRFDPSEML